jgi:acyl-CoA reductase-like NAD-dependent aldehyde dehydrogenase
MMANPVINPSRPQEHTVAELNEAVSRAEVAFQSYSQTAVAVRRRYVQKLRRLIVERQLELARTITQEAGKPLTEVVNQEITAALEMLMFFERSYPRWLRPHRFRYWRPGFWTKRSSVHFEPLGVIAVIGPANYPFSLPVMQTCAALLCGNCVVLKLSERSSRLAGLLRQIFAEAEIPTGMVEVVEGAGEAVKQLISNAAVRKVIFTGSYANGKSVAELCGRYFKPCILELGGSGAAIVCEDADLVLAAKGIAWSAFYASALSCVGTKRVFVHENVARRFRQQLLKQVERIKLGNPLDPSTDVGPPKDEAAFSPFRGAALEGGALLWTEDGEELRTATSSDFDIPTVLLDVSGSLYAPSDSQVYQDDIDAPLLWLCEVASTEQAVRKTNDSRYGLGASVWSKNSRRAHEIACQLHAGMVWINDSSVGQPNFPWGGVKHSGWGRLFSREAISELTNLKVISHDQRRTSLSKLWWFPYTAEKLGMFLAVNELTYGANKLSSLGRCTNALWRFVRHIGRQY